MEPVHNSGCTEAPDGRVTFTYRDPGATSVELAGDFTGWHPVPLAAGHDGARWAITTDPLPPGLHAYKLRVDGRWLADPAQRLRRADGFGGENSVVLVGGPGPASDGAFRILSLNLHTHQEHEPLRKLEDVALAVAAMGVELLLLQEVAEHTTDPSLPNAGRFLQEHLSRLTSQPWHHEWRQAHIGFEVFSEGLSLLSTSPIQKLTYVRLSGGPLARIALAATVALRGRPVRAVTVHTTWPPGGLPEVEALLGALSLGSASTPTLVAGDFNGSPAADHVRRMASAGFQDVGGSMGVIGPTYFGNDISGGRSRIDYQWLRASGPGLAPRRFWRLFEGPGGLPRVSDHAALLGEYAWEPHP